MRNWQHSSHRRSCPSRAYTLWSASKQTPNLKCLKLTPELWHSSNAKGNGGTTFESDLPQLRLVHNTQEWFRLQLIQIVKTSFAEEDLPSSLKHIVFGTFPMKSPLEERKLTENYKKNGDYIDGKRKMFWRINHNYLFLLPLKTSNIRWPKI